MRKPGSPRGELYDNEYIAMQGALHNVSEGHGSEARACAVLWVPDPEARRGLREYYIYKPEEPPELRPLGFTRTA